MCLQPFTRHGLDIITEKNNSLSREVSQLLGAAILFLFRLWLVSEISVQKAIG